MTEYALTGVQYQDGINRVGEIIRISGPIGGPTEEGMFSVMDETIFDGEMEWEQEFEDDLIILVSNLEQMMARLLEEDPLRKPPITAPFFAEMVNRAVSFYEGLPRTTLSAMSLQEELSAAAGIYPMLQLLRVCGNRLALGAADEETAWTPDEDLSIHQVFQGEILILESYFSFFETFFQSPDAQNRWKEVCNVFIAELKRLAAEDVPGNTLM